MSRDGNSAFLENMTNLPKELMEFDGYPHKKDESYFAASDVLEYLNDFADSFDLKKYIKFRHHVQSVKPMDGNRWEMVVQDLINQKTLTYTFDGVIICVGNYSKPVYPEYEGRELCKIPVIHSHDYRTPAPFNQKRALVVGSGPSGLDITHDVATQATTVFLSHHSKIAFNHKFPDNVVLKPDVLELTETAARFADGTCEDLDIVIYCTGFTNHYPFLHESCGIKVINKHVQPLYKHLVNIEHPSMCILGIPRDTLGFYMVDLQVRFFLQLMRGDITLSKTTMFEDTEADIKSRLKEGQQSSGLHLMRRRTKEYLRSLGEMMKDESPVPSVLLQIYFESISRSGEDFMQFRKDQYKIVSEKLFVREPGANK